jgi:DNA-binding transcriptional LysR family regulator
VIVSPDGGGFVGVTDEALAKAGAARNVVLSVPHFLFMLSALAATDLVAMVPERLVKRNAAGGAGGAGGLLRMVEPPVDVPGYEMAMLWHERSHRDPAHQWLRETIAASV